MTHTPHEIVIQRTFNAPRSLVYQAWTDPQHLMRWWGPKGFIGQSCSLDLRVGGRFVLDVLGPDGQHYPCEGTLQEVILNERLVYEGMADDRHACGTGLPPHAQVVITFSEAQNNQTTLTIIARLRSANDRQAVIDAGYAAGWGSCLDRLHELLA